MATVKDPPTGAEHALQRGRQRLVVSEAGGGARSWTVDGSELLASFGAGTRDAAFAGKPLMPWPNRLRDGRYSFEGAEHRVALTEPETRTALHGLTLSSQWRASRTSAHGITLTHQLRGREGYPFALDLAVGYELDAGGVVVTLRATNAGPGRAPFGAGLHPYLRLDGDVTLQVPARSRLPVDDRLLPTGPPAPVSGTDLDFRHAHRLGDRRLDTCFGDLERGSAGVASVAIDGARRLVVWMDDAFHFVQVFTADGAIAVEPMTCAPDAFNTGDGLLVLEPGASFTGRCGLTASGYP
ncbi:MAG: aldose 1-epimerase [Solirubrobacteraceae bacterium]